MTRIEPTKQAFKKSREQTESLGIQLRVLERLNEASVAYVYRKNVNGKSLYAVELGNLDYQGSDTKDRVDDVVQNQMGLSLNAVMCERGFISLVMFVSNNEIDNIKKHLKSISEYTPKIEKINGDIVASIKAA